MSSNTETSEGKEHLIESGELTIGEPCSPYTLLKSCVTLDGNIEIKERNICGRKIPLSDIRKSLLTKHESYMRLNTEIEALTQDILKLFSAAHHHVPPHYSIHQLRTELATIKRTRAFGIWHDHSTILKTSYIVFAVWVIYDPAGFLTAEECKSISNLQELIEEPT